MTLVWQTCYVCRGLGELGILKSRIQIIKETVFKNKIKDSILPDEVKQCPHCKGRGQVYIKSSIFKPWNPFRKDN